jgi:hypothetical protein
VAGSLAKPFSRSGLSKKALKHSDHIGVHDPVRDAKRKAPDRTRRVNAHAWQSDEVTKGPGNLAPVAGADFARHFYHLSRSGRESQTGDNGLNI